MNEMKELLQKNYYINIYIYIYIYIYMMQVIYKLIM